MPDLDLRQGVVPGVLQESAARELGRLGAHRDVKLEHPLRDAPQWVGRDGTGAANPGRRDRRGAAQRRGPFPAQAPQRVEEPARGRLVPPLRVELELEVPQASSLAEQWALMSARLVVS